MSKSEYNSSDDSIDIDRLPDQDIVFQKHCYKKIGKISNTLQGEMYKAIQFDANGSNLGYVAIKRTNKHLLRERIAIEDDISLCVSENIVKEALILRYLTVDHTPIGNYIVKYIDFFESSTDWYLVMEYIESEMNLKQFIAQSRAYIERGLLAQSEYSKILKYVLWQLFVTTQWIHTMNCCHLDLCSENVMLTNVQFIKGTCCISINPKISIKLVDFGVAEVFNSIASDCTCTKSNRNIFLCEKTGLSIVNEGFHAPNVFQHNIFNAKCADNWMLGMLLFECMTVGQHLYSAQTMYCINSGYWSLCHGKLREYVANNHLSYFSHDSLALLLALLNVDEQQRLNGVNILKHKWFKIYFARYRNQIIKKFYPKKQILIRFPFYK